MDIWKKNILEDLEVEEVKYESAGKFLIEIKKEFEEGDEELVKIAKLKKMEQLKLTYSKGGTWLKYFGYSNLLCARATRATVNHVPIGEY